MRGAVYDSKEDAEKRKESGENYVTTIKIEWEEYNDKKCNYR